MTSSIWEHLVIETKSKNMSRKRYKAPKVLPMTSNYTENYIEDLRACKTTTPQIKPFRDRQWCLCETLTMSSRKNTNEKQIYGPVRTGQGLVVHTFSGTHPRTQTPRHYCCHHWRWEGVVSCDMAPPEHQRQRAKAPHQVCSQLHVMLLSRHPEFVCKLQHSGHVAHTRAPRTRDPGNIDCCDNSVVLKIAAREERGDISISQERKWIAEIRTNAQTISWWLNQWSDVSVT